MIEPEVKRGKAYISTMYWHKGNSILGFLTRSGDLSTTLTFEGPVLPIISACWRVVQLLCPLSPQQSDVVTGWAASSDIYNFCMPSV